MLFDENRFTRTSAERFNAHSTGAGKQVHEARAGDQIGKYIKKRFAQAVAGGAQRAPFQLCQLTTAKFSRDDAHEQALADSRQVVAPLPLRWKLPEHFLQRFACGGLLDQAERFFTRALQQFAIAQRIGHVEADLTGLPSAKELARPANQ